MNILLRPIAEPSFVSMQAEFFQEPGNLCIDPDVQEAYMGTEMAARVTSVVAAHQLASQPPPQPQSWFGSSSAPEITDAGAPIYQPQVYSRVGTMPHLQVPI